MSAEEIAAILRKIADEKRDVYLAATRPTGAHMREVAALEEAEQIILRPRPRAW